ncbi:hypothetical protein PsorP6_000170 [Peronosclerospora sorghi]|uniref:Uncharacterized protein n=1 Tax=Peronosclerospora sorghi TaxID=230839 RepID=A0ACC0WRL1_9STRA|nr:hypothetical protein PsorP6_000170 [Peronosclerospora sorghi]
MAMTNKEEIVDALLDDYVPSNGGHVAGSAPSSGLFAIASTMSYRKRERSESECTRKRALKSGRKTEEMLELVMTRIQVRLELFDDAEEQSLVSHTILSLGDTELLDYISTSQIRKIVCYWKSEVAHPRESGSSMVRVQVMTVRPGAKLCEEHRLKARFLPLRINIDQEVVKFLRQFVPMDDEASTWDECAKQAIANDRNGSRRRNA